MTSYDAASDAGKTDEGIPHGTPGIPDNVATLLINLFCSTSSKSASATDLTKNVLIEP